MKRISGADEADFMLAETTLMSFYIHILERKISTNDAITEKT